MLVQLFERRLNLQDRSNQRHNLYLGLLIQLGIILFLRYTPYKLIDRLYLGTYLSVKV